jgi:hypothetical protein
MLHSMQMGPWEQVWQRGYESTVETTPPKCGMTWTHPSESKATKETDPQSQVAVPT